MRFKKYLKESLSKSQKEIDFALEHYPFSDIDIPRSISVTGVRYLFSQLQDMEQLFEIDRYNNAIYYYGNDYEAILEKLGFMILENFEKHPEKLTTKNYEDMLDYKEKCDVDDDEDDEWDDEE